MGCIIIFDAHQMRSPIVYEDDAFIEIKSTATTRVSILVVVGLADGAMFLFQANGHPESFIHEMSKLLSSLTSFILIPVLCYFSFASVLAVIRFQENIINSSEIESFEDLSPL